MRSASQQRWGILAHYSLLYRRNCSVKYPADTLSVWATTGRDSIGMTPIAITSLDTMSIPKKPNRPSSNPHAILLEIEASGGEERTKALGITTSGRVLAVVFALRGEAIRPITAYPAPARLEALYFKQRRL